MKNKVLVIVLSTSLMMNFVTYYKFNQAQKNINDLNISIKMLNRDLKAKKDKIMELEDVIQNKDHELKIKQKIIDNQNKQINQKDKEIKQLKKQVNFNKVKKGSDVSGRKINVIATAYIARCREGCTGVTATGVDVTKSIYYKGMRIIAVDKRIVPLNSIVKVETETESFTAIAIDTGGGINGHKIDVLVASEKDAIQFGRQRATLTILREGSN